MLNFLDENGIYNVGIFGGFVIKIDDDRKIYVLICNYLFLDKNEVNLVYVDNLDGFREIGICVFLMMDKLCDFVVIEIMDLFLDNCEVIFRWEDEKIINVWLYIESLYFRIVYKIGVVMNVIIGIICSFEWYKKI